MVLVVIKVVIKVVFSSQSRNTDVSSHLVAAHKRER